MEWSARTYQIMLLRFFCTGGVHDGGMAAAASEEKEQCKEVEIVPAAPDPDQLHQQEEQRDVMAHPDSAKQHSTSEQMEAKIKELLSSLIDYYMA
jgi:hypothetical protein